MPKKPRDSSIQYNALAYVQGRNLHIAPEHEKKFTTEFTEIEDLLHVKNKESSSTSKEHYALDEASDKTDSTKPKKSLKSKAQDLARKFKGSFKSKTPAPSIPGKDFTLTNLMHKPSKPSSKGRE